MSHPTVSAIVVVYNGVKLLGDCLASLLASDGEPLEIIVIDNNSSDGSADLVRSQFPQVRLFEYPTNAGYGVGNNRGIRVAQGDFLFMLNQDARVEPDTIRTLANRMEADPTLGIAGGMMRATDGSDRLCSAGLRANRIFYGSDLGCGESPDGYRDEGEILGVTGSAMMLRRTMLDAIGGFDERFFLYYEDLDLSLRAWLAGWRVLYLPDAVAFHPFKTGRRPIWFSEYLDCKNRWRLMLKNVAFPRVVPLAIRATLFDLNALKNHLLNRRWSHAAWRLRALLWTQLYAFDTLRERRRVAQTRKTGDEIYTRFLDDREVHF